MVLLSLDPTQPYLLTRDNPKRVSDNFQSKLNWLMMKPGWCMICNEFTAYYYIKGYNHSDCKNSSRVNQIEISWQKVLKIYVVEENIERKNLHFHRNLPKYYSHEVPLSVGFSRAWDFPCPSQASSSRKLPCEFLAGSKINTKLIKNHLNSHQHHLSSRFCGCKLALISWCTRYV